MDRHAAERAAARIRARHSFLDMAGGRPRIPVSERFHDKYVKAKDGCWLWTAKILPNGYGCIKHERKDVTAHRVSWELHYGPIPEGMHVCHKCDVRRCVNPEHLFLGTHDDNMADCARKGRHLSIGETNPKAKLTPRQVLAIRTSTRPAKELAKQYGVYPTSIWNIKSGKTWSHL